MNDLQESIGHQFLNTRHLLEALRAAGTGNATSNAASGTDGNKRLAQLGDAIIKMIIMENWYLTGESRGTAAMRCFPDEDADSPPKRQLNDKLLRQHLHNTLRELPNKSICQIKSSRILVSGTKARLKILLRSRCKHWWELSGLTRSGIY